MSKQRDITELRMERLPLYIQNFKLTNHFPRLHLCRHIFQTAAFSPCCNLCIVLTQSLKLFWKGKLSCSIERFIIRNNQLYPNFETTEGIIFRLFLEIKLAQKMFFSLLNLPKKAGSLILEIDLKIEMRAFCFYLFIFKFNSS